MVVDVQCIMENLANVAKCFHTKMITTNTRWPKSPPAKPFTSNLTNIMPWKTPRRIVKTAIDNFHQPQAPRS